MQQDEGKSVSAGPAAPLLVRLREAIAAGGQGWMGFDDFMALALYTPGLGYYSRDARQFGALPAADASGRGSDFITAPELSPLFGRALARQVGEALEAAQSSEVWEFGAGSGALAQQLLDALGERVQRYTIVDLSGSLRARQQQRLAGHAGKVHWADALPDALHGVVVGNEVLDAMPVKLLQRRQQCWHERGVRLDEAGRPAWVEFPTALRPSVEIAGVHDYLTEIHPQAQAFVATLAERLQRGAAFFIDYGFPEAEYYHPQRSGGTLMCHRAHHADADPLADLGDKDITAHVNFTTIALAAQDAGLDGLGYTTQAHFLINCGLLELLQGADARTAANAQKLLTEHEMGELFKVIGFARRVDFGATGALGFSRGDRCHTL